MAHIAVTIGIVLAALAALPLSSLQSLRVIVPDTDQLPQSLWTACLAAIVGVFLLEATKGSTLDSSQLLKNSRASIPDELWGRTQQLASEVGTDPALARAILAVENLQRPSWFRKAERLKGKVWKRGSYGIMQVQAKRPLTDEESVEIAVRERLVGIQVPQQTYGADYEELRKIVARYNPDDRFVDMASAFYEELQEPLDDESRTWKSRLLEDFEVEELVYQAVPAATGFLLGATAVLLFWSVRRIRQQSSSHL